MAKLSYTINGVNFASKTELAKYTKELLKQKPRWVLYGEYEKFMFDLIDKMYPCPQEKFGSMDNINNFEVIKDNNNAPALLVLLKNGKKLPISYNACFLSDKKKHEIRYNKINNLFSKRDRDDAFRNAIEADRRCIRNKMIKDCLVQNNTKIYLKTENITINSTETDKIELDHVIPFVKLIDYFCVRENLNYAEIELKRDSNKIGGYQIKDDNIRGKWVKFHGENAQFQLLTKKCNSLLSCKGYTRKKWD